MSWAAPQGQGNAQNAAVRLLLDSHITKATLPALKRRAPELAAEHIADWRPSAFIDADDAEILAVCFEEGRVLVTYDQRTVPGLLRAWAKEERSHAGVIFGDRNTVPPDDAGAVAASIMALVAEIGEAQTTNLVRYLRRARR